MKEIAAQITKTPNGLILVPYSIDDQEKASEFVENQIVKLRIYGTKKARSYLELKAYHACCRKVAENSDDPELDTKEKVDYYCRIKVRFIDFIRVDGYQHIVPKSIAYAALDQMEAHNFFGQAFELLAKLLGVTVEQMLNEV